MQPFQHQVVSTQFILDNKYVLDFSDPGTGKTRTALDAIKASNKEKYSRTLVLCPRSIMEASWRADCLKFTPSLTCAVASAKNRQKAFTSGADIVVMNHDGIKWLLDNQHLLVGFGKLFVDESTAFKHHTSKRSKALKKLSAKFEDIRVAMTGTPTSNGVLDIWHQVFIVDQGQHLGQNFYKFRGSVCEPIHAGYTASGVTWAEKEDAQDAVADILSDITIRNVFEECQDIPEQSFHTVSTILSNRHFEEYEELRKESVLFLKNTMVEGVHAAALASKLLQLSSGAVYNSNDSYDAISNDRTELVLDLVEQRQHSIVAFNWKHQCDSLESEAKKRGIRFATIKGGTRNIDKIVDDFQKGRYQVIFAQPQSASHGLTLTKATTTIWASPTYDAERFEQFNRRAYRTGQTKKTEVIMIAAEDTIEEHVYERLQNKRLKMQDLLKLIGE